MIFKGEGISSKCEVEDNGFKGERKGKRLSVEMGRGDTGNDEGNEILKMRLRSSGAITELILQIKMKAMDAMNQV